MRTRLFRRDGVEVSHSGAAAFAADAKKTEGYFAAGAIAFPRGSIPESTCYASESADEDAPEASTVWQWANEFLR